MNATTYAFADISLIIGSITVAILSLIALVTVLLRRRHAAPKKQKRWLKKMLREMAHADSCLRADGSHTLNPARIGLEKL